MGQGLKHEGVVFFVMTVAALRCVESDYADEEEVVVHESPSHPLCWAGAALDPFASYNNCLSPSCSGQVGFCCFDKTGTLTSRHLLLPLPLAH